MNADQKKLIESVRQLVDAENEAGEKGREKADGVVAANFTRITRSSGVEQNRLDLLNAIAEADSNVRREFDDSEFDVRVSGDLGVVCNVVTTRLQPAGEIDGRYRNTHVFERQDGAWLCVSWQVTKLSKTP